LRREYSRRIAIPARLQDRHQPRKRERVRRSSGSTGIADLVTIRPACNPSCYRSGLSAYLGLPVTIAARPVYAIHSHIDGVNRHIRARCLLIKRARPSTRVTAPSLASSADAASGLPARRRGPPITLSGGIGRPSRSIRMSGCPRVAEEISIRPVRSAASRTYL